MEIHIPREQQLTGIEEEQERTVLLQGSPKTCNPRYAAFVDVPIPDEERNAAMYPPPENTNEVHNQSVFAALDAVPTLTVRMEEKNVYCGPYNVRLVYDRPEAKRVTHYAGKRFLAVGSYDNKVRIIDIIRGYVVRVIAGHAGSVRCVYLKEDRQFVVTGSYDTTVRCWSTIDGSCLRIYRGHTGTVVCLDMHDKYCASGSTDNKLKVWNFHTGKCYRTFYHGTTVRSVQIIGTYIVTGDDGGKVRLWALESSTCVKVLEGHEEKVNSVHFDQWHIVSGSSDRTARLWITPGKYRWSVATFSHPYEVLGVQFISLRLVTGCADGKIRLWNMLNGECLRCIRGNSRFQPIITLHASKDRLAINTHDGVYLFAFLPVKWDYMTPDVTTVPQLTLTEPPSPTADIPSDQQKATDKISRPRDSSLKLRTLSLSVKHNTLTSRSIKRQTQSCYHPQGSSTSSSLHPIRTPVRPQSKRVAWGDSRSSISTLESELPEKSLIRRRASDSLGSESLFNLDDVFTVTVSPVTNKANTFPVGISTSGSKTGTASNPLRRASASKVPSVSKFSVAVGDQHHLLCSKPPTFPLKPDSLNLRTYTEHRNRILTLKAKENESLHSVSMPLKHAHSWVAPTVPSTPPRDCNRASSCGPRL